MRLLFRTAFTIVTVVSLSHQAIGNGPTRTCVQSAPVNAPAGKKLWITVCKCKRCSPPLSQVRQRQETAGPDSWIRWRRQDVASSICGLWQRLHNNRSRSAWPGTIIKRKNWLWDAFEYFKAFEPTDATDNRNFAKTKLPMPLLVIEGEKGMNGILAIQAALISDHLKAIKFPSGHWLMEEKPVETSAALKDFFANWC